MVVNTLFKYHGFCMLRGTAVKAKNYRKAKGQPYTRKKYIRGHPAPRITKFTMGDTTGSFAYQGLLIAQEEAQVRHVALEAARVATNRVLSTKLGENYFLRIKPYPHTVLRENKMIFGAHADRLQDGMKKSFGKPIGTAARVKRDQTVITARVNKDGIEVAKEALRRGGAKLPMPCQVVIEKIVAE
jgi:large subunit ribosomal protein L10e